VHETPNLNLSIPPIYIFYILLFGYASVVSPISVRVCVKCNSQIGSTVKPFPTLSLSRLPNQKNHHKCNYFPNKHCLSCNTGIDRLEKEGCSKVSNRFMGKKARMRFNTNNISLMMSSWDLGWRCRHEVARPPERDLDQDSGKPQSRKPVYCVTYL
jgi:hypothetical protein